MTKRIFVVQNSASSPIGLLAEIFVEEGVTFDLTKPYQGDPLPNQPNDYDGLVILGGPQNALADDTHPYLPALTKLIRSYADTDKAVAGICLGAQVIARAFNAKNILNQKLEFGYHPVYPLEAAKADPVLSVIREPTPIFQWHVDTFTIPAGGVHLAKSDMTQHQAVRIGRAVYAFQFHFELIPKTLDMWQNLAEERFAKTLFSWRETFKKGRKEHAEAAERVGRDLTRAWLKQAK